MTHHSGKHLMNERSQMVAEACYGYALAHPHVMFVPEHKVLVRRDIDQVRLRQVTLISGGGAGHEPAHGAFVGAGMLSAAVSGDIFASPSTRQILATIRLCQSPHGTLLIVKQYTGDVLNFGLAVERATLEGIKVAMVVVGDDVAVGKAKGRLVGRRGLAGTVFAHKLAGAMADEGRSLEEIKQAVQQAVQCMATLGVALTPCDVPGSASMVDRLQGQTIELGMGIHGEIGCATIPLTPSKELAHKMFDMLTATEETDADRAFVDWAQTRNIAIMINNLGGTSALSMSVFTKDAVEAAEQRGLVVQRVYAGHFMTSLNMSGVSITLLQVEDANLLERLDATTLATGWQPCTVAPKMPVLKATEDARAKAVHSVESGEHPDGRVVAQRIRGACRAVIAAEPELTQLDLLTGDGDCGQTLKQGAEAVLNALDEQRLPLSSADKTALAIGDILEDNMGGTSGALYCIFFNALSAHLAMTAPDASWITSSKMAVEKLQQYTLARVGDRTLMDALIPFVSALNDSATLSDAAAAAQAGAKATEQMAARLGRASYVGGADEVHSIDAGAQGVAHLVQGFLDAHQS